MTKHCQDDKTKGCDRREQKDVSQLLETVENILNDMFSEMQLRQHVELNLLENQSLNSLRDAFLKEHRWQLDDFRRNRQHLFDTMESWETIAERPNGVNEVAS